MTGPVYAARARTITVREVLHGQVWLHFPETVVADDGEVLATVQDDGCPLTFPEHPFGPHPWSHVSAWRGPTVLKLRRTDVRLLGLEVLRRCLSSGTGTSTSSSPSSAAPTGSTSTTISSTSSSSRTATRHWKDVEDLAPALASGRIDVDQLRDVLAAATEVTERLDRDDRWWAPWDEWAPTG